MALKMSYESADGVVHPESYWRIVEFQANDVDKIARVLFHAYKDQAARLAGKSIVGMKSYTVSGDKYSEYDFLVASGINVKALGYELAKDCKDVPTADPAAPKSFFDGALDV